MPILFLLVFLAINQILPYLSTVGAQSRLFTGLCGRHHPHSFLFLYLCSYHFTASLSLPLTSKISDICTIFWVFVHRSSHGMFLVQRKYMEEIIARAKIRDCNPCSTPVDMSSKLSSTFELLVHDPTLFRSLAEALQYLTFTRLTSAKPSNNSVCLCTIHIHHI